LQNPQKTQPTGGKIHPIDKGWLVGVFDAIGGIAFSDKITNTGNTTYFVRVHFTSMYEYIQVTVSDILDRLGIDHKQYDEKSIHSVVIHKHDELVKFLELMLKERCMDKERCIDTLEYLNSREQTGKNNPLTPDELALGALLEESNIKNMNKHKKPKATESFLEPEDITLEPINNVLESNSDFL
jgi:hypothetical protein